MTALQKPTPDFTDTPVQTNLNTDFLKLIAFATMTIDHIGYVFFPYEMWLRIIGRIAFPLFAYCLAVGCIYTKNPKKYAVRLLLFALVSQPFYSLAFYPVNTAELFNPENYVDFYSAFSNISSCLKLNIGFTLLLALCAVEMLKRKKWLPFGIIILISVWDGFEYSSYGVVLVIFMYIFCQKDTDLFGLIIGLYLCLSFLDSPNYVFMGIALNAQGFAVSALPLLLIHPKVKIKIPRILNYGFYPLHIFIIYLAKIFIA